MKQYDATDADGAHIHDGDAGPVSRVTRSVHLVCIQRISQVSFRITELSTAHVFILWTPQLLVAQICVLCTIL
jgi:hypothetical protein